MTEDEGREHVRRLEAAHPRWLVFYGSYSRQFVAYPLFPAPERTVLIDPDPGRLEGRMREIELTRVARGIRNL
jgi:hypothetical protein